MTRTDSEGRQRQEREEYWVTVTDFDYKLDLTEFIFPYGFIQSVDDQGQNVPALIAAYLADDNMLKTLQMTVRQILVMAVCRLAKVVSPCMDSDYLRNICACGCRKKSRSTSKP